VVSWDYGCTWENSRGLYSRASGFKDCTVSMRRYPGVQRNLIFVMILV
jgi:hypothetical protein